MQGSIERRKDDIALSKAYDSLLKSNIFEYKNQQAKEKAKILSVNPDFQVAVQEIRKKWRLMSKKCAI